MNSGPASRTRNGVRLTAERRSLSRLPYETLEKILTYVALFDGSIWLRLVCRRFDAILSSLLLSSINAYACFFYPEGRHNIIFQINNFRKSFELPPRVYKKMCCIDSHIQHATMDLAHRSNHNKYDTPKTITVHRRLVERIVMHMQRLKSIKLLYKSQWFFFSV